MLNSAMSKFDVYYGATLLRIATEPCCQVSFLQEFVIVNAFADK